MLALWYEISQSFRAMKAILNAMTENLIVPAAKLLSTGDMTEIAFNNIHRKPAKFQSGIFSE